MIFPQCDPPIQHTNNEQKEEVHKTTIEIGTEEKEDLIVTATPAIVTEDQLDSISFYDDVGTLKPSYLGLGGGDLYESIAGSILNLAKRNSSMEDMYSSVLYASKNEGESIDNVSLFETTSSGDFNWSYYKMFSYIYFTRSEDLLEKFEMSVARFSGPSS